VTSWHGFYQSGPPDMELSNKAQSEDQELGLNPVTRQPTLSKAAAAGCTV